MPPMIANAPRPGGLCRDLPQLAAASIESRDLFAAADDGISAFVNENKLRLVDLVCTF